MRGPALFNDAGVSDVLLMIVAACVAVLHGAVLPAAMFVFGLLTNAFVNQYSSAQLANYELEFDPLEYISMGRFAAVDVRVIVTGFINFTNITGGVVNCSDSYELLPFNQSFDDILQVGVTRLARCLDNPTFLSLVNRYTVVFVGLGVASWLLGGAHVSLFRLSGVWQVRRLRSCLFSSLLQQEAGWFDATPPGEVVSRITEDVGKVEEGLGEKQGLLLQWTATLVAGVIVSLYTEWRLTLLIAFAGLLIAASTALLSVVRILSLMGVPLL
jgi:ABC-type multidrug transport system fused ATPase/permease subunit